MPSLASVTFDDSGFAFQGERDGARIWHTEAGDGVGLYYFALKPDIDADLRSIDDVRQSKRSKVAAAGSALIELEPITMDGCPGLRQIIKVPQRPHGMTYVGGLAGADGADRPRGQAGAAVRVHPLTRSEVFVTRVEVAG